MLSLHASFYNLLLGFMYKHCHHRCHSSSSLCGSIRKHTGVTNINNGSIRFECPSKPQQRDSESRMNKSRTLKPKQLKRIQSFFVFSFCDTSRCFRCCSSYLFDTVTQTMCRFACVVPDCSDYTAYLMSC